MDANLLTVAGASRGLRGLVVDFRRLRWAAILIPLLFLFSLELLRLTRFHEFSHSPLGVVVTLLGMSVAVSIFAASVFREIERLEDRARRRTAHLAALNRITAAAAENLDLTTTVSRGLEEIVNATGADASLVCRLHADEEEHSAVGTRGFSPEMMRRIQRAKLADDAIASEVVRTKRAVRFGNIFDDPEIRRSSGREGIVSGISVPLISGSEVNGIVVVAYRTQHRFDADEQEFLRGVGAQLGMAIHNAQMFEQSLQQNRELSALLQVQNAVSSSLELDGILGRTLEIVGRLTGACHASIWLREDGRFVHRHPIGDEARAAAVERLGVVREAVTAHSPQAFSPSEALPGMQTGMAVPLSFGDQVLGVLVLLSREPRFLGRDSDRQLLQLFSEQIATGIENALLHRQIEETSVLRERERISREMHDGLGQVLGYVNTQVLAVRKLLEQGASEAADAELRQLEKAARSVYADVRDSILALRAAPAERGLVPTLEEYIEAYREMFNIDVNLIAEPDIAQIRLPGGSEIQLIRIVQQALSNVRQHSGATTATVRMTREGVSLAVRVEDNGAGFDPEALAPTTRPRFGLQMMRERAQAAGGEFLIERRAGGGTRVSVRLPLA